MYKAEKEYYKKSFLIATIMAAALLLPFVITDGGYFVYYMDYNVQQIPFYQHCVEAVRSGFLRWDWQTDLGASFIGSYTYYTLGSPFFWFMTLFPSSVTRYLMAPMICVKLGLISLIAFIYIRRFTEKPQAALIGGLIYAFSSFDLYSVVFQFQDAFIWFPLMLTALEEAVLNKRRGLFAAAVALNCFANFFFFVQEAVFIVIYFLCRLAADKRFRINAADFLCLAFESVSGVMIAGVLFIPSVFQVLDVPRATHTLSGWDFLFYKEPRIYGLFLESIFFPGEIPLVSRMFMTSPYTWTNAAAYLPLFSAAGAAAFIKSSEKGHWVRYLLPICLLFYFVPGLNAMFTVFNTVLYARWLYMPVLICCMATACALERKEYDWDFGYRLCELTVFIMALLVTCAPFTQELVDENGVDRSFPLPRFLVGRIGLLTAQSMDLRVLINIGLAFVFLAVLRYLLRSREKLEDGVFMRRVTAASVACSLALGYYYIGLGRAEGMRVGSYNEAVEKGWEIDDGEFHRTEIITPLYNVNMMWNESTIDSFHSVLPSSIIETQNLIGARPSTLTASVSSVPNVFYAYRALTGVKYLQYKQSFTKGTYKDFLERQGYYRPLEVQNGNELFISDYALPMGFAYDDYYPIDAVPEDCMADNLMVGAVLLTREQAAEYSDILTERGREYAEALIPESPEDENAIFEIFVSDAARRTEEGVSDFTVTREGFTARCGYDSDKLVMFSVPYCKGWSAFVNGSPVKVEKVNGGFCAIRVPAGASDIRFEYLAPGMSLGIIATAAGAAAYGAYLLIFALLRKKSGKAARSADEQDGAGQSGEVK